MVDSCDDPPPRATIWGPSEQKVPIISEVLDCEGGWKETAQKAFMKKFKDGPSKDIKTLLKQKNFLHNRGFSFQEIESVLTDDML